MWSATETRAYLPNCVLPDGVPQQVAHGWVIPDEGKPIPIQYDKTRPQQTLEALRAILAGAGMHGRIRLNPRPEGRERGAQ